MHTLTTAAPPAPNPKTPSSRAGRDGELAECVLFYSYADGEGKDKGNVLQSVVVSQNALVAEVGRLDGKPLAPQPKRRAT
jgi:hypothetical protein